MLDSDKCPECGSEALVDTEASRRNIQFWHCNSGRTPHGFHQSVSCRTIKDLRGANERLEAENKSLQVELESKTPFISPVLADMRELYGDSSLLSEASLNCTAGIMHFWERLDVLLAEGKQVRLGIVLEARG